MAIGLKLKVSASLLILASCVLSMADAAERPNVVMILTDDQGWGDLSLNGNTNLATPNIDSIGTAGAIFERFFVCPVCSPTRAEMLTGRYHPRGGVFNVTTGGERLNLDERTIGDVFKSAGYVTGCFGKWHNGTQYPYHPRGRGFDEFYGFCSGHWGDYFDPPLDHNGKPVVGKGFLPDDLTDHALRFLEQHRERPFFCYVPFNTPHTPAQVPDKYWAKFENADLKLRAREPQRENVVATRATLAMVENIDWNVGRILKRLDELKLADNTIVVFFCDNGPNGIRWNGGMKGIKGTTDEGGVRSPLLIRWPKHIRAGSRIAPIAGAIDLLPTLADLTGISNPPSKPLDGVSMKPLLLGTKSADAWPDRMIFSTWAGKVSVRTQQYRLDAAGKLFDMFADPGQDRDVSQDHPEITKQLTDVVAKWRTELLTGHGKSQRPFTVGYREFPITTLPARDGVPHGNVQRSARAPNCSYFTNWKRVEDSIAWDIEVATSGRYEVEIDYACPKADLGSVIDLGFNGSRLEATITEPHDPPQRGAENDRAPRDSESLVKDFKPLRLGVIELKSGQGELALKATKVANSQVMEVRNIRLTLLP